jgi:subtilisin family serine protease
MISSRGFCMDKVNTVLVLAIDFMLLAVLIPMPKTLSEAFNQVGGSTAGLSTGFSSAFPSKYIDPDLLNSSGPTRVLIVASDSLPVEELAKYMISVQVTPSMGGSYLATGVMQAEKVEKLAENQYVSAVLKDKAIEYDTPITLPEIPSKLNVTSLKNMFKLGPNLEDSMPGNKPETTLRDVVKIIGADKSWTTYNITGKGTTIAIVDTGVDYGAFSLAYSDSLARDEKGYPAAFDADAICMAFTNITVTAYATSGGTFIPTNGTDPDIYYLGQVYSFSGIFGREWFSDMRVTGILSAGEKAHFGLMFEDLFGFDLFPVLVVDSHGSGVYDTVYVDLAFDRSWIPFLYFLLNGKIWPYWSAPWPPSFSFAGEVPLTATGQALAAKDFTGDGVYDLSAGVLGYFLDVWGVAPNIYDKGGVLKPIDPYGNYTCFENDWIGHGTSCASCAAGRDFGYPLTGAGVAPGSKIMGVVALQIGDVIEGTLWAAGFDLIPGTGNWTYVPGYGYTYGTWNYTARHKADIISNSWGVSEWAPNTLGLPWYDVLSMFEDALTVPGYLDPNYPGTVIVFAGGNGAAGYGTITSPGHASLPICVGASTSMNWSKLEFGFAGGHYDDIISWSARGPTPLGYVKPDVVNIGAFGFTATAVSAGLGDGSQAVELFGGTSMATPLTAGAASLIIQAYDQTHGLKPTPDLTKVLLKSTAKDLGYDAFVQGAGRVDALSAVELALDKSNVQIATSATWSNVRSRISLAWSTSSAYLYSSLPSSSPENTINDTGWFAGFVQPGATSTAEFTVKNPATSNVQATITPVVDEPMGPVLTYEGYTGPLASDWATLGPWGNLTVLDKAIIPSDADLMLVSLTVPYQYFDVYRDYQWEHRWRIFVLDWNDANNDGIIGASEVYLINYGYNTGTSNEARVGFPSSKFKFTPVIFVSQADANGEPPIAVPFNVTIQFYKRTTWNWMTAPSSLTIASDSSEGFNATINVPQNASQGVYEGQIILNITAPFTKTIAIPVSVSVPAVVPTNALTYNLSPPSATELYDPYSVNGYFDWSWRYEAGDWKIWLVDIQDPSVVGMFVSCNWTNSMTGIDMFAINPNGFIVGNATTSTSAPPDDGRFLWNTTTTSREVGFPISLLGTPTLGVYTILLHNVLFNGTVYPEKVTGKVELVKLAPSTPANLAVKPGNSGSIAFTLSTGRELNNVTIKPYAYTPFPVNISQSFISKIPANGSVTFNAKVTVPDGTPTGTYRFPILVSIPGLTGPPMQAPILAFLNTIVDDTPPSVNTLAPIDGEVLGGTMKIEVHVTDDLDAVVSVKYSISGGSYTNLTLDTATGLWVANVDTAELGDGLKTLSINATDEAGNSAVVQLTFVVDNTAPAAQLTVPSYVRGTSTINLTGSDPNFDRTELYIGGDLVETWNVPGNQTYSWNTTGLTDGTYLLKLLVYDKAGNMAARTATSIVDNTMPIAEIKTPLNASYIRRTYAITIYGYDTNLDTMELYIEDSLVQTWNASGTQTYYWNTTSLTDGAYRIRLLVEDKAGNAVEKAVNVTLDNTPPTLSIIAPAEGAELSGNASIRFTVSDTDLDRVLLYLDNAVYNVTGTSFNWVTTTVGDGTHTIKLVAYDKAGNTAETSITVTTTNVRLATDETRDTYLAIGLPIGLIIGALVVYVFLRKRR